MTSPIARICHVQVEHSFEAPLPASWAPLNMGWQLATETVVAVGAEEA